MSRSDNIERDINDEVEEDSSDHDEDDIGVGATAKVSTGTDHEGEENLDDDGDNIFSTDDNVGPSGVKSNEDSEGEKDKGEHINIVALKLMKKARRSFPDIMQKYQITEKRIEMDLVHKNFPDVDNEHSILILEGQLRAGVGYPV
ncbi:hypothetical protein FRX31_008566 [Thalictrum thalictroides]|uniref:Uncharacterized protein n=1 Tax=Thalictrum thalictroides TaxID=46969 RepID=A0A7J6WZ32_THATH|nr:hypothetical protein FRX31_008566 [Thalictrum thalictroides]